MERFSFKMVSPNGPVFDGTVWQISARDYSGSFSIRANHAPFFTILPSCEVEIADTPEARRKVAIQKGLLEFAGNSCTVICETPPLEPSSSAAVAGA